MRRNHIIQFFASHTKYANYVMSIWPWRSFHIISSIYLCFIYAQFLLLHTYIISQDVRTKSINLTGSHQTSCVQPWWDFLITNLHMNQDIVQILYVESVSSADSVSIHLWHGLIIVCCWIPQNTHTTKMHDQSWQHRYALAVLTQVHCAVSSTALLGQHGIDVSTQHQTQHHSNQPFGGI